MKEKKHHIDLHEGENMVAEPAPTHRVSGDGACCAYADERFRES